MIDCRRSPALPRGFSHDARLYLRPAGLITGAAAEAAMAAGTGRRLAGGRVVFTACEVFVREKGKLASALCPLPEVDSWTHSLAAPAAARARLLFERLTSPRAPILGVAMDRPAIMGVVNVTPDSFSDGGDCEDTEVAVAHGRALAEAGADIIDVGGESTRPGSDPVPPGVESARVLPVVRDLAADGRIVSIDSRRAAVTRAALDAGARLINDVSALTYDPAALDVVAASGAPVVLMHALGDPKTMQVSPVYDHAPLDVFDYLEERVAVCTAAGVDRDRIVVDPGIGFGKTLAHNLDILHNLALLHGLGCPLLLGVSRKSFIGRITGADAPKERLSGSLAAGLAGISQGVQILRVHDVSETAQALAVWNAISG